MSFRFKFACPRCNKETELYQCRDIPKPLLHCLNCLLFDALKIDMQITSAEEMADD